jgi:hypothetical protein
MAHYIHTLIVPLFAYISAVFALPAYKNLWRIYIPIRAVPCPNGVSVCSPPSTQSTLSTPTPALSVALGLPLAIENLIPAAFLVVVALCLLAFFFFRCRDLVGHLPILPFGAVHAARPAEPLPILPFGAVLAALPDEPPPAGPLHAALLSTAAPADAPMSSVPNPRILRKVDKITERKLNRKFGKKQKFAGKVAEARQRQRVPPYGIHPITGVLRTPQETDMAIKAWKDSENIRAAKASRTVLYNAMSPADKAERQSASATQQAAQRLEDQTEGIKEKNRKDRVTRKKIATAQRTTNNRIDAHIAKAAFSTALGLPPRWEVYTSPKGSEYQIQFRITFVLYFCNISIVSFLDDYNGKDVRQAVYASEFARTKGGVGYNAATGAKSKNKEKMPKVFHNRKNTDNSRPLPGVPPDGLSEFPIVHERQKGYDGRRPASDARIITKQNAAGLIELVGKVGHSSGSTDHHSFQPTDGSSDPWWFFLGDCIIA